MRHLKFLALEILPERLLFEFKKIHYFHELKSFLEKDLKVVELLVKPADYVIDIGANVGWYTKVLSNLVGSNGRVYSIEPIPSTFDLLSYFVKKFELTNVEAINCAISNQTGDAIMEIPKYKNGGKNFYQARMVADDEMNRSLKKFRVNTISMNQLFCRIQRDVSFIKCDVEGHELAVIEGSAKIIEKSKPAWLLEITRNPDDAKTDAHSIFQYMKSRDYEVYWFDQEKLKRRAMGDKSDNYFFLTSRHLDILSTSGMAV